MEEGYKFMWFSGQLIILNLNLFVFLFNRFIRECIFYLLLIIKLFWCLNVKDYIVIDLSHVPIEKSQKDSIHFEK